MADGKLKAVVAGSKAHLALIKAGWKTHHTDGKFIFMEKG